ncbi:Methyltransferase type 11 - like 10 [Theobroma cacao]|nr:Methyltransferase type 11 - like 10 [Theobroma cacao]
MLVLVIVTNLLSVYIFTGPFSLSTHSNHLPHLLLQDSTSLLQEVNSTKVQLLASYSLIAELHHKINSTNLLVQALLIELTRERKPLVEKPSEAMKFIDDFGSIAAMSDELRLAILPQKCLINRNKFPGHFDCKDCFDLQGREKRRWLYDRGLDYGIDQVLQTKPPRTIRIGLDIGGGSGTFAARMRERNITIITSSMNLDGPFNSFIASRGLIPIHVSVSQRLPFFDNTLDIVHSMHVLSNWIPDAMLELTLYDIYRVLRPGGLFWLDHFFCQGSQLNQTYVPMLGRIGFKKLRWNSGKKLDRGVDKNEWYFSALLEKPKT